MVSYQNLKSLIILHCTNQTKKDNILYTSLFIHYLVYDIGKAIYNIYTYRLPES